MYLALTSGDHVLVQELWQCGLTTTARVRCCSDLATIVLDTIAFSETLQANEKSLRDTFLAFSEKVALLYPDTTKQAVAVDTLLEQGVRYNGTKMNRTMYFACMLVAKEYTGTVRDRLVLLERKHGRDLLSLSYNKMMRIAQIVQKLAGAAPTSDGLCFVLEMMHISIARKMTRNGSKFFYFGYYGQTEGRVGWVDRKHVCKVENDSLFVKQQFNYRRNQQTAGRRARGTCVSKVYVTDDVPDRVFTGR